MVELETQEAMANQPPRPRPQLLPRTLRLEPYNPPKNNWGKALRGLDMGIAILSGLNSEAGALRGLDLATAALSGLDLGTAALTWCWSGPRAISRLWSGVRADTGANSEACADTGANSGAGTHSLFLHNLLVWAEEREITVRAWQGRGR